MSNSVYLYAFSNKANIVNEIISIYNAFSEADFRIHASLWICEIIKTKFGADISSQILSDDIIISIGGDGTMLKASKLAINSGNTLLGVNSGKLGFLTEFDLKDINSYIDRIINNDYVVETRNLLRVKCKGIDTYALNDVVISRGGFSKLIDVSVFSKNNLVTSCTSDGIIVATPTGSTAYSLSAGGPIVSPDVDCFIITPVSAHSLMHRSICISNHDEISIRLNKSNIKFCQLIIDGSIVSHISNEDVVLISKHYKKLKVLRFRGNNFFDKVRNKLSEWK